MSKASLPPGFRFHPTDVELVCYYLKRKIMGRPFHFEAISEIELYRFSPWDLPDKSQLHSRDLEWYFFCRRDRKYPNGSKANRTTDIGYWKITGKGKSVTHNSCDVGMKKTLIFYVGKAPKGERTNWEMYEYRLQDKELADTGFSQDAYVLCKIFQKSGLRPKVGEQYGATFNEEDWEDDTIMENFSFPYLSCPSPKSFDNQAVALSPVCQQSRVRASVVGEVSSIPNLPEIEGISLEQLVEALDASQFLSENNNIEMSDTAILHGVDNEISSVNIEEIYDELKDLSSQAIVSGNIWFSDTFNNGHMLNCVPSELGSEHYVELNDLCFLGGGETSESVMPNYPSSQYHIACYQSSQDLNNLYDSSSYFDNVVATASGAGYYCCAGYDMIHEQSEQDLQIEAFVGSLLHPTAPGFEAQDIESNYLPEELAGAFL